MIASFFGCGPHKIAKFFWSAQRSSVDRELDSLAFTIVYSVDRQKPYSHAKIHIYLYKDYCKYSKLQSFKVILLPLWS